MYETRRVNFDRVMASFFAMEFLFEMREDVNAMHCTKHNCDENSSMHKVLFEYRNYKGACLENDFNNG